MNENVFSKILYGIKVANDNIIVLNEKMDELLKTLSYEESEPNGTIGTHDTIDGLTNTPC